MARVDHPQVAEAVTGRSHRHAVPRHHAVSGQRRDRDARVGVVGNVVSVLLPTAVAHIVGPVLGRDTKSAVHLGVANTVWMAGTQFADWWVRRRGVQFR